ncbi:hypothetical protein BVG79_01619 [Ketogulonicigenium robustum]|uniref:DUF58 domain-containing protein n=1 Tax=Ketogulonicigenium robustum TaxID=92947 RepID=A0A1W6P0M5_9RHOB|nr:DUF58 domain-containing protein [Ketogulonicigenium robustum]ARO14963.1 hypothetical protein BVG79_01619 [Ketogulonicigenium robustum]
MTARTVPTAPLRSEAEALAASLPALMAAADALAATITPGVHGRRRAGMGDTFWEYRAAEAWDDAARIDWRRSGRGDTAFVQDREWQLAQSVSLWVDDSAAMRYTSGAQSKADVARKLALALAILLERGGERVGYLRPDLPPRRGRAQLERLASALLHDGTGDYGTAPTAQPPQRGQSVLFSDFFGDLAPLESYLAQASASGGTGLLVQVLDPAEEAFPFQGRTLFQSMVGALRHESLKADSLRAQYQTRLAARKDALFTIASRAGWRFHTIHTDTPPTTTLMWLFGALEGAL